MIKKCSKCKVEKKSNCFNSNKTKADGLSTECKDCVNEHNRAYRAAHKVEAQEYSKMYRKENKEKITITKNKYIQENKVIIAIRQHMWYEQNKELTKQRTKERKKNNPLQYSLYTNKRRAQKNKAVVEGICAIDIINKYGDNCVYCGKAFEHIDHYMPLSKGGTHTLENVRPSCKKCNLMKNNKTPTEWFEFLQKKKAI